MNPDLKYSDMIQKASDIFDWLENAISSISGLKKCDFGELFTTVDLPAAAVWIDEYPFNWDTGRELVLNPQIWVKGNGQSINFNVPTLKLIADKLEDVSLGGNATMCRVDRVINEIDTIVPGAVDKKVYSVIMVEVQI